MGWTTPADKAASTLITASIWNQHLGTTGNEAYLKSAVDAAQADIVALEAADLVPMKAQGDGGAEVGGREKFNFISGTNITVTVADAPGDDRINVTLASSGSSLPTTSESSGFVAIQTAASQNVKGAWTELIAAAGAAIIGIDIFCAGPHAAADFLFDIGVGAVSSEVATIKNLAIEDNTISYSVSFISGFRPISIANGARISARAANTTNNNQYTLKAAVTIYE